MLGEVRIPVDVARLICRRGTDTTVTSAYELADLYFVEISSAKLLTCRDWPVQLNYVARHFADFLSDRDRARWLWELAAESTGAPLLARFQAEPAYARLDATDQALLADLRLAESDPARLGRDIDAIVDRLGAERVVLVTHVDAQLPDGGTLASRSKLIAQVRNCAQERGLRCNDPTPGMEAMGQERALEKEGLDTAHYTLSFADMLCDEFHALLMPRPSLANTHAPAAVDEADDKQSIFRRIEREWEAGDFRAASQEVRCRIAAGDATPGLEFLLGRMSFELGDYATALESLSAARDQKGPDDTLDRMRMLSARNLGKPQIALKIGEAMLADETETDEIIETCANAALAMGRLEVSTFYWKRQFWMRGGDETAARIVLGILAERDLPEARAWRDSVFEKIPSHSAALIHLWNDLVTHGDRTSLFVRVSSFAVLDTNTVIALAAAASDTMPLVGARLLEARGAIDACAGETASRLGQIAIVAGERCRSLTAQYAEASDAVRAVEPLQAATVAHADARLLAPLHKLVARTLRLAARVALAAGNNDRVVAICTECMATGFDFMEMRSFLGRALIALDRAVDAMAHLRAAADNAVHPAAALFHVARLAVKAGLFADAIEAGTKALSGAGANIDHAAKLLDGITTRSLRDVRRMTAEGRFEEAWRLSTAMTTIMPEKTSGFRERNAILRSLRALIGQSEGDTRLEHANRLLALDPSEPTALRTAAVETMRNHDFAASLGLWQRLNETGNGDDRINVNIGKCRLLLERIEQRNAVPAKAETASLFKSSAELIH